VHSETIRAPRACAARTARSVASGTDIGSVHGGSTIVSARRAALSGCGTASVRPFSKHTGERSPQTTSRYHGTSSESAEVGPKISQATANSNIDMPS
jgi:hypothetical protein